MKVVDFLNRCTFMRDSEEQALIRLQERYGIKSKYHEGTGLYVLNYDQIESSKHKTDQIVRECRSLVLGVESVGDCNEPQFYVVSRSFDRFFNHGEHRIPCKIDKLNFYEKMDGSLVTLFHVDGEGWLYRTKSMIMPEEDMKVNGFNVSWKELIEESLRFNNMFEVAMEERDSYIFEVTAPENRVVTRYNDRSATLLAIRDNTTGVYQTSEWCEEMATVLGYNRPKTYSFDDWTSVEEGAKLLPNLEEGFVGYRNGEPMVKVKNPAYVAAHHLRGDGLNPKRCMDLVLMNETDEYLTVFPEDDKMMQPYISAYSRLTFTTAVTWEKYEKVESQKEFAFFVKDLPIAGVLFSLRKGLTVSEAWDKLTTNHKYKLIEAYKI